MHRTPCLVTLSAVAGVCLCASMARAQAPPQPYRLEYSGSARCQGKDDFLWQLEARTHSLRAAREGEKAPAVPATVVVRRRMLEEIDEDKTLRFQQMSRRSAPCFSQYSRLEYGPVSARPWPGPKGADFDRVAEGAGIEVLQIAACTPRMNAVCERFLGGGRRECFDHLIILGERHLRSVLGQYVRSYFNTARPHKGIHQRVPLGRHASGSDSAGKIIAFPVLNGLHHDYRRVA